MVRAALDCHMVSLSYRERWSLSTARSHLPDSPPDFTAWDCSPPDFTYNYSFQNLRLTLRREPVCPTPKNPPLFDLQGSNRLDSIHLLPLPVQQKVVPLPVSVTQNLGKQTGSDGLARMQWHDGRTPVCMLHNAVTSPLPLDEETVCFQHTETSFPSSAGKRVIRRSFAPLPGASGGACLACHPPGKVRWPLSHVP